MTIEVLLGIGFAVCSAAILCGVFWMFSLLSGWHDLAQRFRFHGRVRGRMYRFRPWGSSRWPAYRDVSGIGALNVIMGEKGLLLVSIFPPRLFHPPLLIPWGEMDAAPYGHHFFKYCISIRSVPDMALYFGDWFCDAARYLNGLKRPEKHPASE